MYRFLLLIFLWAGQSLHAADVVRLAVTTSFQNAGLADILLPEIRQDIDIDVQMLVVGTGQALRLGQAGDVDAVLVHSPEAEKAFVAAGHGLHRREIMYNDFVIVGPSDDPAGIGAASSVGEAFLKIESNAEPFVSRGDDSGTHKREVQLWAEAGRDPASFDSWYNAVGAGMGASLNTAAGLDAYILTDRGSWLKFQNKRDLVLLFEGDDALLNQYAFIPVSDTRHSHVAADAVKRLEDWLTSARAQELIDGYRLNGAQLFTFNATPR